MRMHKFLYKFDTVLYQFLETGTSDRCLIGIVQLLRFSGFILYPLLFFLYSPFKKEWHVRFTADPFQPILESNNNKKWSF